MSDILYFEDVSSFASYVKLLLPTYNVTVVDSLSEGQRLLQRHNYDLLLVDLNLKDSWGLSTLSFLTEYNIPIIVLSEEGDVKTIQEAADMGVQDYFVKDFIGKDLVTRIKFVESKINRYECKESVLKLMKMDEIWAGFQELKTHALHS